MEQIILRFPHLGQGIFDLLDNNDLEKSREVDRYWNIYIAEQKFYSIRIIKGTIHILRKHVLFEQPTYPREHILSNRNDLPTYPFMLT